MPTRLLVAMFLISAMPGSLAAAGQDAVDRLMQQHRPAGNLAVRTPHSDYFSDPLGRFMDMLGAGAFIEAKSLQNAACENWRATRNHSSLTGKFWVWGTELDLDELCRSPD